MYQAPFFTVRPTTTTSTPHHAPRRLSYQGSPTIQVWPKSNLLHLHSGSEKQIQGIRSDRVPEELWTQVRNIAQEVVIKTISHASKVMLKIL